MEILSYFINMKNVSRKPYIYKVTNLETGQYYIGSQCSGKIVGVNYFTSSHNKEFKEEFKTYGDEKYKIETIKEFEDPEECVRAENYMIRDHMILKDGLCLNRFYFCNGEKIFSRVGTHHSEETKKKLSRAMQGRPSPLKGIPLPEETRKRMSISSKGQSPWNKGQSPSEETRKKLSKTMQGRPSPRRIKISIEGEVFNSLTEASKYYNVHVTAIRYWVKTKNHIAVYIEK